VVVTPDGTPPADMAPNQYDYCISYETVEKISENARQQFISQYRIDPYPPENDNVTLAYNEYLNSIPYRPVSQYGPHEMYGMIVTKVVTALNTRDRPLSPYSCGQATMKGFNKFNPAFQITTMTYYYYGYWNAADVTTGHIYDYYADLIDDCHSLKTEDNQVIYGWIRNTNDDTGYADGFYACSKERTNFPLKGVAQHEISHCYGALDHGWWNWPPCVMAYLWLWLGITDWCGSCHDTIYDHIWNY
jgi:hypothetical protein